MDLKDLPSSGYNLNKINCRDPFSASHPTHYSFTESSDTENGSDMESIFCSSLEETDVNKKKTQMQIVEPEPQMPQEKEPKLIQFGENVQKLRLGFFMQMQSCQSTSDFAKLGLVIDSYIQQALNKGEALIAAELLVDKAQTLFFGQENEEAVTCAQNAISKVKDFTPGASEEGYAVSAAAKYILCGVYNRRGEYGETFNVLQEISSKSNCLINLDSKTRFYYNKGLKFVFIFKTQTGEKSYRTALEGVKYFELGVESLNRFILEENLAFTEAELWLYPQIEAVSLLCLAPNFPAKREIIGIPNENLQRAMTHIIAVFESYFFIDCSSKIRQRIYWGVGAILFRLSQNYQRDKNLIAAVRFYKQTELFLEGAFTIEPESQHYEVKAIYSLLEHVKNVETILFLEQE